MAWLYLYVERRSGKSTLSGADATDPPGALEGAALLPLLGHPF